MKLQRIQFLEKYAARAESLLSEKFGNDYTPEDVEKLAEALIEYDVKRAATIDRVEDISKQAQYTAKAFADQIDAQFGVGTFKKLAKFNFMEAVSSMAKNSKSFGEKVMGAVKSTGQRAQKLIKTDPKMAAGLGALAVGTGAVGNSLVSD